MLNNNEKKTITTVRKGAYTFSGRKWQKTIKNDQQRICFRFDYLRVLNTQNFVLIKQVLIEAG